MEARKVLILYLPTGFQGYNLAISRFSGPQKPKGGPWESKFFLLRGLTKWVGGGREPSKILPDLYNERGRKNLLVNKG